MRLKTFICCRRNLLYKGFHQGMCASHIIYHQLVKKGSLAYACTNSLFAITMVWQIYGMHSRLAKVKGYHRRRKYKTGTFRENCKLNFARHQTFKYYKKSKTANKKIFHKSLVFKMQILIDFTGWKRSENISIFGNLTSVDVSLFTLSTVQTLANS